MDITQSKIMIGNKVLKSYGTLRLEHLTGNNFSYELPLKTNDPAEHIQLAGKNIYIWILLATVEKTSYWYSALNKTTAVSLRGRRDSFKW